MGWSLDWDELEKNCERKVLNGHTGHDYARLGRLPKEISNIFGEASKINDQ